MKTLTISIALCTYNGERFLQEQLDSLAAQTRLPDEVVVGDDGSTDRTLEILEEWAGKVPFPIRIQRNQPGLGPAQNFFTTIQRCEGEIVFLCDQDDYWLPDKLQKMVQVFEKNSTVGLVYCQADTMDQNGQPLGIPRSRISRADIIISALPLITPHCFHHNNPPGCCSAIRKAFIRLLLPFPENFPHDIYFFLKLPAISKVVTIRESLIRYRLHEKNVSFQGNWRESFKKHLHNERTFYKWSTGFFLGKEPRIQAFMDWLDTVPDTPYKRQYVSYLKANQRHYPNRERIQRNFFIFFPLFFVEVFAGRYFRRFQPIKSIVYDVWTGTKHGLNPIATLELFRNLFGKVWRKINEY